MKIEVCVDPTVAGSYDWNDCAITERSRLFMRENVNVGMMKYILLEGLYMPASEILMRGVAG